MNSSRNQQASIQQASLSTVELARWRAFALMSRRVTSSVATHLQREAGVSGPDFEILDAVCSAPNGQVRSRDLAEMLTWEKSRISHQVSRMVDRGLLERTECDEDLRGTWVTLTADGHHALQRALPHHASAVREAYLSVLDESQAAAMTEYALTLGAAATTGTCREEVDRLERDAASGH
jgi:DNA-binding MarR family transcriptional regulator